MGGITRYGFELDRGNSHMYVSDLLMLLMHGCRFKHIVPYSNLIYIYIQISAMKHPLRWLNGESQLYVVLWTTLQVHQWLLSGIPLNSTSGGIPWLKRYLTLSYDFRHKGEWWLAGHPLQRASLNVIAWLHRMKTPPQEQLLDYFKEKFISPFWESNVKIRVIKVHVVIFVNSHESW